jgi:hypothetical protein
MRRNLKFILPAVNVSLATALLVSHLPSWGDTQFLAFSITPPAAVLRLVVSVAFDVVRGGPCATETCIKFSRYLDRGAFLLGVPVVWYVVGRELDARKTKRMVLLPSRTWLRVVASLPLISFGIWLAVAAAAQRSPFPLVRYALVIQVIWGVSIAVAYGYDLGKLAFGVWRTARP